MSLMDDMNREADIAREERRHMEMMAAILIAGSDGRSSINSLMKQSILDARMIIEEQSKAGTEGK